MQRTAIKDKEKNDSQPKPETQNNRQALNSRWSWSFQVYWAKKKKKNLIIAPNA